MIPHFKIGDLVLLTISEIRKDYMIANYSRNKKAMIHSTYSGISSSDSPDFTFENYFTVGQFVCGAVVSPGNDIKLDNGHFNKKLLVTIDPKIVNTGWKIEKIVNGMDWFGQLILDDNGNYNADFRLITKDNTIPQSGSDSESEGENKVKRTTKNFKIILTDNDTDEDKEMWSEKMINSYYFFKVVKVQIKKKIFEITVSLDWIKNKFTIKNLDFNYLRPGFTFKANVTRELSNGCEVSFGGNIGSIFIDHINMDKKNKNNLLVRVIHVSVSKHLCSLSTLPHIKRLEIENIQSKRCLVGKKFNAEITKFLYGKSYELSLITGENDKWSAFLHNNNIAHENGKEINIGDKLENVLIKEYNFFDDYPICTALATTGKLITWDSIRIGDIIPCKIKQVNLKELIVSLTSFIEGKIPLEHWTDHPLSKIPKKFKVGTEFPARVFAFSPKTKNLTLTIKETLLDPETPLYSKLSEWSEGEELNVVYVGNGLFSHSNNLVGRWLKFNTMNEGDFKIGKWYKYKIYKIQINLGRMYLTKDDNIFVPGCGDYESICRRNHILTNITTVWTTMNEVDRNDIIEGSVKRFEIVTSESWTKLLLQKGVDVKLIEENKTTMKSEIIVVKLVTDPASSGCFYAFMWKEMASDYYVNEVFDRLQTLSLETGFSGDMLVVYHNNESKVCFVTMKRSWMENKENILHIDDKINNIKTQNFANDKLYFGFVNKVSNKGVWVQCYGKKKILMRVKDLGELSCKYRQGQTVVFRYVNKKFYFDIKAYQQYTSADFLTESRRVFDCYVNDYCFVHGASAGKIKKTGVELNKEYTVHIKEMTPEIIRGVLSGNDNINVIIMTNLFNFNRGETPFTVDEIALDKDVKCKLFSFSSELNAYIAELPLAIVNKIKSLQSKTNVDKNIGDVITGRINGIKGNFIYVMIDKHSWGRIEINNYSGNVDRVKMLLKETVTWRRASVDSKGSSNSTIKELKIKAKITNIETKKSLTMYSLAALEDADESAEIEDITEELSTKLDTSGKNANVGIISSIKLTSKYPLTISINNKSIATKLQVPFNEIPLDMLNEDNTLKYKIGNKIKFFYTSNKECSLLEPAGNKTATTPPTIGEWYIVRILKPIDGRGWIIDLNKAVETFVDICEITDFLHYNPWEYFTKGQITKCRLISQDEKSNRFFASLRASITNPADYAVITKGSTWQFNKRFNSTNCDWRNKILKFGVENVIEQNTIAVGYVTSSSEKGVFIKWANNVAVRAGLPECTDEMNTIKPFWLHGKNNICICRVISLYKKDSNDIKINVSLKESIIKYSLTLHLKDWSVNNFYTCQIIAENNKGFDVNIIGSTFTGVLKRKNVKKGQTVELGRHTVLQLIKCNKDNNTKPTKLRFSSINVDDGVNSQIIINPVTSEMLKAAEENVEIYHSIKEIIQNAKQEKDKDDIMMTTGIQGENEIDFEDIVERVKRRKSSNWSMNSASKKIWNNESDGDDIENDDDDDDNDDNDDDNILLDDDDDIITDKNEKFAWWSGIKNDQNTAPEETSEGNPNEITDKTSTKPKETHLEQELKIREIEETAGVNEEKSAGYYEKLILTEHDNSIYWIQYASYILDTLNLASARKIFERAIKTIDISKQKEKINIWVAYMNLEQLYGTSETFNAVIQRALEVNDKKAIYLHWIAIYKMSKKHVMAYEIFKILIKEYFADFEVWKQYIEFWFEIETLGMNLDTEEIQEKKEGLNRSMQVLPKKKHLDIMLYYAQLLYKYHHNEEARNMFDNILKNLPKRKDIWFVYIDKEIKFGKNVAKVRQIFDLMFDVKFKMSALKSVLKKYWEFERENSKSEKEFTKAQERVQRIVQEKMEVDEEKAGDNEGNEGEEEE